MVFPLRPTFFGDRDHFYVAVDVRNVSINTACDGEVVDCSGRLTPVMVADSPAAQCQCVLWLDGKRVRIVADGPNVVFFGEKKISNLNVGGW